MPAPKGQLSSSERNLGGRPIEWTEERIDKETEALLEWVESSKDWWFLDFCVKRKIHVSVLARLAKKNEGFRRAYQLARQKQESVVSFGCITKKLDGGFGWRFLSSNYKWSECEDRSGIDEDVVSTPGSRALADLKEVCIEHTNALEQTGSEPGKV